MVRFVTLATLAAIGVLMIGAPPSAQSFNVGHIIVTRPIILLSPATGPLELTPPVRSMASLPHAPRFVERMRALLAAPAPLEAGVIRVQPSSIAWNVPQTARTQRAERQNVPLISVVVPVAGTADLSPAAALATAPATASSAATTERTAGQELDGTGQVPPATSPPVGPRPELDPARSGHRGSGHSGSGDGGSGNGGGQGNGGSGGN